MEYLAGEGTGRPFFAAFDAADDLRNLRADMASFKTIRVSDFCSSPDAMPDRDALARETQRLKGKAILLGAGEFAAISGDSGLRNWFFGLSAGAGKLVIPLWEGHDFLEGEIHGDPRLLGRSVAMFPKTGKHWSVRLFSKDLAKTTDTTGFKALLRRLEDGCDDTVSAITDVVPLNAEWCRRFDSAYDLYRELHPASTIPKEMFPESQWKRFLDDGRQREDGIASADKLLELLENGASDPYLALVLSKTGRLADWKRNLLLGILDVPVNDQRFGTLRNSRNKISGIFDTDDVADFIRETHVAATPEERIRYLSDATIAEREEIMRVLAEARAMPACVRDVYPALWNYWQGFPFTGDGFPARLDGYFQAYKRQKIFGHPDHDFEYMVRELAEDRPQFTLQTRESVLESIGMANAALCWVDALGCEFLGAIRLAAESLGLKLKVTPARAKLPSITTVNKGFFDNWPGEKMTPVKKLDKIKHGEFDRATEGAAGFAAQHLPHELAVIDETMRSIASWLRGHPGGKVVLTSDHGATRLAVLCGKETIWEMPEKGRHGGRCCRKNEFDGTLPSCVTESDDGQWHVLAGYDRFKGGRKGDVEVHGGATLEEMVVPVIELGLLDRNIRVRLLQNNFKVTFRDKEIAIPFLCTAALSSPSLEIAGRRFPAECVGNDSGQYIARVPKPASGRHEVAVYDGDTKVSAIAFDVTSGGAQIKKDDFF